MFSHGITRAQSECPASSRALPHTGALPATSGAAIDSHHTCRVPESMTSGDILNITFIMIQFFLFQVIFTVSQFTWFV